MTEKTNVPGTFYIDGEPFVAVDISDRIKLAPRWTLCFHAPGRGDISDFEREVAAEVGVSGVDDDLGFRSLFYASKEDAEKVALAIAAKRSGWTAFVVDSDGNITDPHLTAVVAGVELNDVPAGLRRASYMGCAFYVNDVAFPVDAADPALDGPDAPTVEGIQAAARELGARGYDRPMTLHQFVDSIPTRNDEWVKEAFVGRPRGVVPTHDIDKSLRAAVASAGLALNPEADAHALAVATAMAKQDMLIDALADLLMEAADALEGQPNEVTPETLRAKAREGYAALAREPGGGLPLYWKLLLPKEARNAGT